MDITLQLNDYLRNKLTAALCLSGKLTYRQTAGALLSLHGRRADGKDRYFWEPDYPLMKLIDQYLKEVANDSAALEMDINLENNTFIYDAASGRQLILQENTAREKARDEARERMLQLKKDLLRENKPYGRTLAVQVAEALATSSLYHSHRDYCGMGLQRNENGQYEYGDVYDGYLQPLRTFNDIDSFVDWLSAQSDASLANLESADTWVWNNQVINGKRLADFVQMASR